MMERTKQRRLAILLGLVTLGACLLIIEGGIRVDDWRRSGQPKSAPQDLPMLRENPAGTGSYRLRPNLDLETRVGTNQIRIRTNSHGMHWRETPLRKSPGRKRVAFLGDSFTFGCWASDVSRSFVGTFDQRLGEGGYEALNFGVGGFGFPDHELILKEMVLSFEPSYVVVVSYMGNDFRDTWLGLNREDIVNGVAVINQENLRARVPAEFLKPDDRIPLPCDPPLWRRIAERSAAFRRAAPLLHLENLCVQFRPNRSFLQPAFWSILPVPEVAAQAKQTVFDSLSRLETVTAAAGAKLLLVALPTAAQVYAQETARHNFDTALPQADLQTFCRDRRIPFLDLLPMLREQSRASNQRLYLKADIHLTDFGHAKVGEMIADWFSSVVER